MKTQYYRMPVRDGYMKEFALKVHRIVRPREYYKDRDSKCLKPGFKKGNEILVEVGTTTDDKIVEIWANTTKYKRAYGK